MSDILAGVLASRRPRSRGTVARRLAASALLFAIAGLSLLPASWKRVFTTTGLVHHIEHFFAFCVLFLLCSYRPNYRRRNMGIAIAVFAFGILLETLQTRAYGSRLEYIDIFDDGCGVTVGFVLAQVSAGYLQLVRLRLIR